MSEEFKGKYIAWIVCVFILGGALVIASSFFTNAKLDFSMDNNTLESVKILTDASTRPTCEEGCVYIKDNWLGFNPDEMSEKQRQCVQYCSDVRYEKQLRLNNLAIPTVSDGERKEE